MTFVPKDWRNAAAVDGGGDTSTPLDAAALEDMEQRLSGYTDDRVDPVESELVSLDEANLTSASAALLGLSQTGNVRRGKSIIATEQATTSTSYTTLTTPDRVENVVLPAGGILCVSYQATQKESVLGASRVAIFLGANQLKRANLDIAAPAAQETTVHSGAVSQYKPLATHGGGLYSPGTGADVAYTGDVTTGQVLGIGKSALSADADAVKGGPCLIFADAGTYTVSIQFKTSSGTVTVKDRRLYVWTMGF